MIINLKEQERYYSLSSNMIDQQEPEGKHQLANLWDCQDILGKQTRLERGLAVYRG
ncbi:MAG: hypothetical protein MUO97_09870 [Dehalococcoidia bacterium]|nr:hypothetical protein [Dehalococcoidia bacterium]